MPGKVCGTLRGDSAALGPLLETKPGTRLAERLFARPFQVTELNSLCIQVRKSSCGTCILYEPYEETEQPRPCF